jgi:hypothetical protein
MSVTSLTTTQPLPRKVTNARLGFQAIGAINRTAGHGFGAGLGDALGVERGVDLGVGELVATGLGLVATIVGEGVNFAAVGATEPQADAISAVTARVRIQSALFMSLQR